MPWYLPVGGMSAGLVGQVPLSAVPLSAVPLSLPVGLVAEAAALLRAVVSSAQQRSVLQARYSGACEYSQ